MTPIVTTVTWPVGGNNIKAIYDVCNDDYRYNFYDDATNFDRAKQIGTELLHMGAKLFVAAKGAEWAGYEVGKITLDAATSAATINNGLAAFCVGSTVRVAYDNLNKLGKAWTNVSEIRSNTSFGTVGKRLGAAASEVVGVALSVAPIYMGYSKGGLGLSFATATMMHHVVQNQNKAYQNYISAAAVGTLAAAMYFNVV